MIHTFYVALPFTRTMDGHLVGGEAKECGCAESATQEAEQMSATSAGAVAFARSLDLASGTCGAAILLRTVGEVPRLQYLLAAA